MASHVRLLDVVALTVDIPAKSLRRGQVGTIVEVLAPGHYDVEFCDDDGRTYALVLLAEDQLLVLRYGQETAR